MSSLESRFKLGFSIVGFQKSGTSTLHKWLTLNAAVTMPKVKETHFFLTKAFSSEYVSFFGRGCAGSVCGEADPEYLYSQQAILNLLAHNRNMKFLVVLRNPFDRAYSHYCMQHRRSLVEDDFFSSIERLSIEARSQTDDKILYPGKNDFLSRSLYSKYVASILELAPAGAVKFVLYEDLFDSNVNEIVFRDICGFIGVKARLDVDLSSAANVGGAVKSKLIQSVLFGSGSKLRRVIRPIVKVLLPLKWRQLLSARLEFWNLAGVPSRNKLSDAYDEVVFPEDVVQAFNSDIKALSSILGERRLMNWIR